MHYNKKNRNGYCTHNAFAPFAADARAVPPQTPAVLFKGPLQIERKSGREGEEKGKAGEDKEGKKKRIRENTAVVMVTALSRLE